MTNYRFVPASERPGADYAIRLEDDALAPLVPKGRTVYLQRSAELQNGEVGLFRSRDGMVFRQFCQDIRGTVYLFALDREERYRDLVFPPEAPLPVCYGRVLLEHLPELPID